MTLESYTMTAERDFNEYRRGNDTKVDALQTTVVRHIASEKERDVIMLKRLDDLTEQVTTLTNLWEQAKGVVLFVKLASAVVAGCAAAYVWINTHLTFK
jgi:hypothetical protein